MHGCHPLAKRSPRAALTRAALLLVILACCAAASAQEDLYGPQAPTDAAYVRAVNAAEGGGLGVRVGDGEMEVLPLAGATGYVLVEPGPVRLDLGGEEVVVTVEIGDFVTVAVGPSGVWTIVDTPLRDASRGMLALYNLSDRSALDLVVIDGPSVVADVAPGEQAAIAIAEAEVALRVRSAEGDLIDLDARLYARGVAHAVFVVLGPDGLVVGYDASRLD